MSAATLVSRIFTGICLTVAVALIGLKLLKLGWAAALFGRATGVL
jgi:hypothetical protein